MTLGDASPTVGVVPLLSIDARYLFGAPADDIAVEGEIRLRTIRLLEGHSGYLFGRHDT